MFPKLRSSALRAAWCPYHPLCLHPPCPSLSSPSPWSPPTQQAHPLCRSPHSPLHLPLLCHGLRSPNPTTRAQCWPTTTSSWCRTIITHSLSPKLTTLNCCSRHLSSWSSAIPVPLSHPHSNMRYSPSQALCSSRLLYKTVPSAGEVLLTMAVTLTTRRDLEGRFKPINLFTLFIFIKYVILSINTQVCKM